MTFTQFLCSPTRPESRASFLHLVRHDPLWPAQSDRLADFETFLLSHLGEESKEVIPELRKLWSRYAGAAGRSEGKPDLDLALALWGDYARHRQDCAGSPDEPCATEQDLLEAALEASGFEDHSAREALACSQPEGREAEFDGLLEDRDDQDDEDDEEGEWEAPTTLC